MAANVATRTEISGLMFKAAGGSASWGACLQEICSLLDCDKAYLALHHLRENTAKIAHTYNIEDHYVSSFNEDLNVGYPWTKQDGFFQAAGLVWPGSQIVPIDQLRETEFYNLFMAPQAMLHSLHGVLRADNGTVTELVLTRTPKQDPFGDNEVALVREMAAPAQIAIEAASETNLAMLTQSAVLNSLDDTALGLALLVAGQSSIRSNAAFSDHMAKVDLDPGKTFFQEAPERKTVRLPKCLVSVLEDEGCRKEILLHKLEDSHPIAVHIHRTVVDCPLTGIRQAGYCLLTRDPEQELDFDPESLRDAFELTPAEIRVAAEIARCRKVEQLATDLSITPSTARTHLKRIFDKTGTSRQSELVRLMLATARKGKPAVVPDSDPLAKVKEFAIRPDDTLKFH